MVKNVRQLPRVPEGIVDREPFQTANALHSAALRLLRRARSADSQMDLDGPRASALSVLVFGGPVPIGRLAALEQVSPPAISKTVTALEADGLAQRVPSAQDRRVVLVRATPRGRVLLERGRAARVRLIAGLIEDLAEPDRRTLARAAAIIARVIATGDPRRGGRPRPPGP